MIDKHKISLICGFMLSCFIMQINYMHTIYNLNVEYSQNLSVNCKSKFYLEKVTSNDREKAI